jgi:hypothetical protein
MNLPSKEPAIHWGNSIDLADGQGLLSGHGLALVCNPNPDTYSHLQVFGERPKSREDSLMNSSFQLESPKNISSSEHI